MVQGRVEPYQLALTQLRERLHLGILRPGARVIARDVADELRLSATPVREALARLAGEGLLQERRGDGFFVPSLTAADAAILYRLSLSMLLAQVAPARPRPDLARVTRATAAEDAVLAVERLFAAWIAEAGSAVLAGAHRRLTAQLGPLRRREPLLIPDLAREAESFARLADGGAQRDRRRALVDFHERRLPLAQQLVDLLAPLEAVSAG